MPLFIWEKDNPTRKKPLQVYLIVVTTVVVFLATRTYFPDSPPWAEVLSRYAYVPNNPTWGTAIAYMFFHSSFVHLCSNIFFLWKFGDNVEDVLGSVWFTVAYVACGIVAIALHTMLTTSSATPVVGASGAVSGVLGLYAVLFRHTHVDIGLALRSSRLVFHVSALGAVVAWLILQLGLALLSLYGTVPSVAYWAHVGGFSAGLVIGHLLRIVGFKALPPWRVLRIERESVAEVWCPHCGAEQTERHFGKFRCQKCGTKYLIFTNNIDLKKALGRRFNVLSRSVDAKWTKQNDALIDAILLSNSNPEEAKERIHSILARGININARNEDGRTALAVANYHEVPFFVVSVLRDAGGQD